MGPLCFLIYTSEINNVKRHSTPATFADDTSILIFDLTYQGLFARANSELKLYHQWFIDNQLTANMSKTKYMVFGSEVPSDLKLQISSITLERVSQFKLVGVYLNDHLNWSSHFQKTLSKIRLALKALYMVKIH